MIRLGLIILLFCLAGRFDAIMDMIKDFKYSLKNWLYIWTIKHPEYGDWYDGFHSLPYFEKKGILYDPGWIHLSDSWHTAKHLMLLSFAGAGAIGMSFLYEQYFVWYYNVPLTAFTWWFFYWLEGKNFNGGYQRLKIAE